jgi:hypothetical protein
MDNDKVCLGFESRIRFLPDLFLHLGWEKSDRAFLRKIQGGYKNCQLQFGKFFRDI